MLRVHDCLDSAGVGPGPEVTGALLIRENDSPVSPSLLLGVILNHVISVVLVQGVYNKKCLLYLH